MIDCHEFYKLLLDQNVDFFTGVPDSLLKNFNACLLDNVPKEKHIIAADEGGAVALATGYHLATKKIPLVYMQNAGQGNSVNPLVSLTDPEVYSVPMLLLIGWRGEPGTEDEPQHVKQGKITLELLDLLGIKYKILPDNIEEAIEVVNELIEDARKKNMPNAVVVRKGTFSSYELKDKSSKRYSLTREEVIGEIAGILNEEDIIVSTTGKASRELFEYRERKGQSHEKDFLTVGSMGHSSQIALGIALKKQNRKVYCFDGDGSLIMHMGSLAIIGQQAQKNLIHIVLNNGSHESVGGQPTAGFETDFVKIAKSCNYSEAWCVQDIEDLRKKLEILKGKEGPILLEIRVNSSSRKDLGRPTTSPIKNKKDFMDFLSKN
ncbi:MAG: phosphonopyruvate decarboxylase [Candidatus Pacearchaeota archaeon]